MAEPRRRRIFLVNKNFQLRFSFYVVSWIFAMSTVYPIIIYQLFNFFSVALQTYAPAHAVQNINIHQIQTEFLWLLVTLHAVFGGVIFLISIFMSHKIAGPLYKMQLYMEDAIAGQVKDALQFRKSDHFQNLADTYNQAVRAILEKTGGSKRLASGKAASDAVSQIEAVLPNVSGDAKAKLESALKSLKNL